jgi:hydrogenase-4 component F
MNAEHLLAITASLAVISAASPFYVVTDIANVLGYAAYAAITMALVSGHLAGAPGASPYFHPDALTLLMLIILSVVGFSGVLFSVPFIRGDIRRHGLKQGKYRKYFFLYNVLFLAMTLQVLTDNIGMMWVSIEATTLATALLVSFDNRRDAVEAAWRYLLICSVGIAFALFGTILTYHSSVAAVGPELASLSWQALMLTASKLDATSMKLAFIFLLLGYGTKAGLVPMARWKPRTYGEAPSSVSAVMSGALVACSIYTLARFAILGGAVLGSAVVSRYLVFFGVLSVVYSAPFMIAEYDLKRLFAYSSIEHVGLIVGGIGFGTFYGIYGALFHVLVNSLIKTALFFSSGNLISATGEKNIRNLSCMVRQLPVVTITMLASLVAVTAIPPFPMFLSEFNMLRGGILSGNYLAVGLVVLSLVAIFVTLYVKFLGLSFGQEEERTVAQPHIVQQVLPVALLICVLVLGFIVPAPLHRLLTDAAGIFGVRP